MKTNKKLKLNTKKVVILSNEQQDSVQGGYMRLRVPSDNGTCVGCSVATCLSVHQCLD